MSTSAFGRARNPRFSTINRTSARRAAHISKFADAIYNTSRSTLLIASIATGQFEMLSVAMKDRLHQPYRASLIPGFDDVAKAATAAGALSVALSGAGPTVAAYCLDHTDQVAEQMKSAFKKHQIVSDIRILKPDVNGASVHIENI